MFVANKTHTGASVRVGQLNFFADPRQPQPFDMHDAQRISMVAGSVADSDGGQQVRTADDRDRCADLARQGTVSYRKWIHGYQHTEHTFPAADLWLTMIRLLAPTRPT